MPDPLTELEHLVLLAVLRMDGDAYAGAVADVLRERAGRRVTLGTLHNTLVRLEEHGLVESEMGESTPVRGGRAKRLYRATERGRAVLLEGRDVFERMWDGLLPSGGAG